MSKIAKVRMADVLTRAGYNVEKSLRACRYPFAESITFLQVIVDTPPPPDEIDILITGLKETDTRQYSVEPVEKIEFTPARIPHFTRLNHKFRVEVLVKYRDNKIDSKYISFNSEKIPPTPGWPVPRVFTG